MHALLERGVDDLGRGEPDALVDHLHAGVAGAHRDLLGAVGMAVEPGLADQKFDAAAELAGNALDFGTHPVEAVARMRRRARHPRRRPIFAEHFAQRRAPFAGRYPGLGALDRGRHDVAILLGRGFQRVERGRRRTRIAAFPPSFQALDLLGLDPFGDR